MPELEQKYESDRQSDITRQQDSTLEQQYQYYVEQDRARQRMALEADLARQQSEETPEPMGWGLFLSMLVLSIILDVIDGATGGTVGWLVGLVGDIVLAAIAGLTKSGRKQFWRIAAGLGIEKIPVIGVLPARTAFLIWSFVKSRSQTARLASTVASKHA